MSLPEIIFRVRKSVIAFIEEKTPLGCASIRMDLTSNGIFFPDIPATLQINDNKTVDIFGLQFDYSNPETINWHRDPVTGEVFPYCHYRKINILKNEKLSAKRVWEINRLQFLTGVCFAYRMKKDQADLDLFIRIIKSWSANNTYLKGINWYSNIEVNLRLITWFLCWEILQADLLIKENNHFKEFFCVDWSKAIYQHILYSYNNPSKYSSANNHLIAEYAGLFIATTKWSFKNSEKLKRSAKRGLESEILKQHSNNGVNKEEAAEYIQFIVDFLLLSYIIGDRDGNSFSLRYKGSLNKIFTYILNFLDVNGNFPKYGDEDDGKCYVINCERGFNNFTSLLTSGAILFKDPELKSMSSGLDFKNQFLFGEKGLSVFNSIPEIKMQKETKFYPEEGHFILRKLDGNREIYFHFDAAPIGFLSIAAHGHADALSFILHVDGQPVFVDPGTFTYHTDALWRQYFIGTLAHNTLRINTKNQALNGGPTLWLNHFKTKIISYRSDANIDYVKATHNGYLHEKAQHIREVLFDKVSSEFQITDTVVVSGNNEVNVEIPFHLYPGTEATGTGSLWEITSGNLSRRITLRIDKKLENDMIYGMSKPFILGWYSPSFMRKEPANVIYCKTIISKTTTFESIIKII